MPRASTVPGRTPDQHRDETTAGRAAVPVARPQPPRHRPRRLQWALLMMFGSVWLIASLRVAELILSPQHPRSQALTLGLVVLLIVPVGLWWWRTGSRSATSVLVALSTVAVFVGDNPSTLGVLFLALVVLMLTFPLWAAIALVALIVLVQLILMTAIRGEPLMVLWQTSFTLVVILAGFGAALLVREFDQIARRNAELLTELRRSVEFEKELVIADERSRAARDLHDGLGHRLAALTMSLEFAERTRDRDPDRAFAEVGQARGQAKEALRAMRTWVRALDPIRVGDAQGSEAFEAIAEAFRGTGLDVDVSTVGSERELPQPLALFSYRCVQEGLTNALKHGGADRVRIVLDQRRGFTLTVSDNGTPDLGPVAPGFGLRSLRERVSDLGGSIEATPARDGFTLTATIPEVSHPREAE